MMSKKVVRLSDNLIVTKGSAAPPSAIPQRSSPAKAVETPETGTEPLNFKVSKTFRKSFKQAALDADKKQVELLTAMFELWQAQHRA